MSFIRWILALPFIVGAVLFALTHKQIVSITWNPFGAPVDLPLYFVALVFLGAGFLLGAFMAWIGMGKVRKERRHQKKKLKQLEKDIDTANKKIMELSATKKDELPVLPNNILENQHDYD